MAHPTARSFCWAGGFLGLAVGGFFDGILLHQILQWHHLLSNVDAARDMRVQILADGLFHALMYAIAAVALLKLWRSRAAAIERGAARRLGGSALLGFGAWHVLDTVLSHWVLGIHRIKMDAANPLAWDLIWFFAFGVMPAVLSWRMLRASRSGGGGGRTASVALGVSALIAGFVAALPPTQKSGPLVVVFAPGVSSSQAFNVLAKADARVLWADGSGGVWAVSMTDPGTAWKLYGSGALLISNTGVSLGCLSWSQGLSA